MIIGDPSILAIESEITLAYEQQSFLALGFFAIHAGGRRYGVHKPDATMMGCSFDEVERRVAARGSHVAPFAERDATNIVEAFRGAVYADKQADTYLEMSVRAFVDIIYSNNIAWAPDGDEAFDDGSYVLQFDVANRVRVIAFKRGQDRLHDPSTLRDVWLPADDFYSVLQRWHIAFAAEWGDLPKEPQQ
jgi:hypothetical protein